MGLDDLFQKCSEPKETNRQIGPLFRRWLQQGCLGITPVSLEVFQSNLENAILDGSDSQLLDFAKENLDYNGDKGLDLIARFNGKYVIGEAKFLTDFGGHQNAQFEDAIRVLHTKAKAIKIAILDGVIYINSNNKMHKKLINDLSKYNIMSALVLRTFLYQL